MTDFESTQILAGIGRGHLFEEVLPPVPQDGVTASDVFRRQTGSGVPMGQHFEPDPYELTSPWLQKPAIDLLLPNFQIASSDFLVDLGCASGELTMERFGCNIDPKSGIVLGVDINRSMIDRARHNFPTSEYGAHFIAGDALQLEQLLSTFKNVHGIRSKPNRIVSNFALHVFSPEQLSALLETIHKISRPSMTLGLVIPAEGIFKGLQVAGHEVLQREKWAADFVDPGVGAPGSLRHPKHLELAEQREILDRAGFRVERGALRKVSYWTSFENEEQAAIWVGANFYLTAALAHDPERRYQWAREVTARYRELGESHQIIYPHPGSRKPGEVYLEVVCFVVNSDKKPESEQ